MVDRDRDAGARQFAVGDADALERIALQQGGLFGQLHQHLAFQRGLGGDAAFDQQLADPVLQRLDPLRYRRGGDVQRLGCALEAAFTDHRCQGTQLRMVDAHELSFAKDG
ncbi:hypothetical protein D3C81_1721250 [compost metagenome]